MTECKIEKDEFVLYYKDIESTYFKDFITQKFGETVFVLSKSEYDYGCSDEYGPTLSLFYLIFCIQKDSEYYIYKYVCNYNYSEDDIYRIEYKKKVKDLCKLDNWIEGYKHSGYTKCE